jgi:hypothetical protein
MRVSEMSGETYGFEGSHGEEISHHRGKSGRQAALSYKTQLQFS